MIRKGNRILAYIRSIINDQDDFNRVYYGNLLWKYIGLSAINYACPVWFCNRDTVTNRVRCTVNHILDYEESGIIFWEHLEA